MKLHDASDPTMKYPDGITYWAKVNEIHYWSHRTGVDIHHGPGFLPWHRELLNRLEKQLQQADKLLGNDGKIMLHYWDWTTDPRGPPKNLFIPDFMGSPYPPVVGQPFADFESTQPGHQFIWRNVNNPDPVGNPEAPGPHDPGAPGVSSDDELVAHDTYFDFRTHLEQDAHDPAHVYLGGGMGIEHYAFADCFILIMHSNVDRLWAKWQTTPGKDWRLSPNTVYGIEGNNAPLTSNIQPWAGDFPATDLRLRPWAPPENWSEIKTYKDKSIVIPPLYDTNG